MTTQNHNRYDINYCNPIQWSALASRQNNRDVKKKNNNKSITIRLKVKNYIFNSQRIQQILCYSLFIFDIHTNRQKRRTKRGPNG